MSCSDGLSTHNTSSTALCSVAHITHLSGTTPRTTQVFRTWLGVRKLLIHSLFFVILGLVSVATSHFQTRGQLFYISQTPHDS